MQRNSSIYCFVFLIRSHNSEKPSGINVWLHEYEKLVLGYGESIVSFLCSYVYANSLSEIFNWAENLTLVSITSDILLPASPFPFPSLPPSSSLSLYWFSPYTFSPFLPPSLAADTYKSQSINSIGSFLLVPIGALLTIQYSWRASLHLMTYNNIFPES